MATDPMSSDEIARRIGEFRTTVSEIERFADEAIRSRDIDDLITVVRGLLDALDASLAMASRLAGGNVGASTDRGDATSL